MSPKLNSETLQVMEGSGSGAACNQGGTGCRGNGEFTDLPPEVMEQILSHLDGGTVIALRGVSKGLKTLVDMALWGKNGQKFWVERLCSMRKTPLALLLKVLGSFESAVVETASIDDQLVQALQRRLSNKLRKTFATFDHFPPMCGNRVVVMKRLEHVENFIKKDMKDSGTVNLSPQRAESTNGSTLFHVRSPSTTPDHANLIIFEKMEAYSPWGIQLVEGKEKIRTVQTITLPTGISPAEFTDPSLIKIPTICVIATQHHIILTRLHRGNLTRIPLHLDNAYRNYLYLPTENRFGIWGEFLGVWHNPGTIKIYKMVMDRRSGDISVEVIKTFGFLGDLTSFWVAATVFPNSYISVLRDGSKNAFKEFPNPGNPVFSLLSPFHENVTVTEAEDLTPRVHKFRPKIHDSHHFSVKVAEDMMGSQATFSHRKSEQNVVVFFNHTWIALLYKIEMWIFEDLRDSLLVKDEILLNLEFQTDYFVILGTDKHIYMTLFQCDPPKEHTVSGSLPITVRLRGRLEFDVLLKIPLDTVLDDPNLRLLHCHFDMDLGRPYIFASFDLPKDKRTDSSFQLMKLDFGSDEGEEVEQEKYPVQNEQNNGKDEEGLGHPYSSTLFPTCFRALHF